MISLQNQIGKLGQQHLEHKMHQMVLQGLDTSTMTLIILSLDKDRYEMSIGKITLSNNEKFDMV